MGWNGLVIFVFVCIVSVVKEVNLEFSVKCSDVVLNVVFFIKINLWDDEKKIFYRIWRGGREIEGFVDDYVYFI